MDTVFFLQLNSWKEPLQCGSVGLYFKASFLKAGNGRTSVKGAGGGSICGTYWISKHFVHDRSRAAHATWMVPILLLQNFERE